MLSVRRVSAAVVVALIMTVAPTDSSRADTSKCLDASGGGMYGGSCENRVEIGVVGSDERSTETTTDSGVPKDLHKRQVICQDWIVVGGGSEATQSFVFEGEIPACVEPFVITEDFCPSGETPLAPRWVSEVTDAEAPSYGPWQMLTGYECPGDPLEEGIASAWRQMVIAAVEVGVQPDNGWAISYMGVMADVDDGPQTSTVTVLGQEVVLRATPVEHAWTVTDVVTGDSWPGEFETASHGEEVVLFDRKEHRVQLGLTTTWEGHYSLNGGSTWLPAPGTATTTSDPLSVHVYNPRARLVNCDTLGDCMGSGGSSNPFTLTDPDADGIDNYEIPDDQIGSYLAKQAKSHN